MKYSIYNTKLSLGDKLGLVYCGATDQFVIYKKELTQQLNSLTADRLAIEAPGLYSELVRGGGIVLDSEDEFEKIKKIGYNAEHSTESYRLILNPTMDCNFKCWYCYENHIKGSKMSKEILRRVLLLISNIIENQPKLKTFDLSFFGGEPLMYYEDIVLPIIDHCRQECKLHGIHLLISFTSNAYLINDVIISHIIKEDETKCFQITLDGNQKKHDKTRFPERGKGSYGTIITNIKKLLKHGIEVILRINYTASNIISIRDVLNDINNISIEERKFLTISFHRVWQDARKNKLSDSVVMDTIDIFRKEFSNVADTFSMNNLRNPCYADKINEAIVNFDGNVFKCTARDFSADNRCGVLTFDGKIIWDKSIDSRSSFKLSRQICRTCRLLPLCGGSCSQKSIEFGDNNNCLEEFNDDDKDKVVMQRFYDCYVR